MIGTWDRARIQEIVEMKQDGIQKRRIML